MRFHSTRKLVKEHKGDVLPMMPQLGHRTPEAQRAWAHMSRLAHSGLFRTCVLSLRGEKMGRNALEIALHKMISEPCAVCNCPIPPTFAIATPAFFLSFGPTTSPLTQNCDLLGPALKPIWSWLRRQTRPETPWQHLAWRALHCGWHQPARQHDVGEYLAFLKPHLGVAACGTWESRLHMSNQPVRCVESGDTWPLLLQTPLEGQLHPPATSISLQSLLDTSSRRRASQGL